MCGWPALVGTTIAVGVTDGATKVFAERHLDEAVALAGGAQLRVSHNSGMAFGALDGASDLLVLGLVLTAIGALVVVASRGTFGDNRLVIGLVLGGALANVVDRIEGGGVTDFIDLGAWPSFNVADAALTVGVLGMLWQVSREPNAATRPGAPA